MMIVSPALRICTISFKRKEEEINNLYFSPGFQTTRSPRCSPGKHLSEQPGEIPKKTQSREPPWPRSDPSCLMHGRKDFGL